MRMIMAPLVAAMTITVASAAQALPTPSQIFVFGDSLSDPGNFNTLSGGAVAAPPYVGGRFSNGAVYAEYFAAQLGFTVQNYVTTPGSLAPNAAVVNAYVSGQGINFAFGGARTSNPAPALPPSALDQINLLGGIRVTSGVSVRSDALAILSIGPNDYFQGQTNPAIPVANTATAITNLSNLGFRNILVLNMPNLGTTLSAAAADIAQPGAAAALTALTVGHNTLLAQAIANLSATLPAEIQLFDTFGYTNFVTANAAQFGFTNLTVPCLAPAFTGGPVAANCTGAYFVDGVHPTTAVHALFGRQLFASSVPEPASLALFGAGVLGLVIARRRAVR
jgi:thermolabile hemolysin